MGILLFSIALAASVIGAICGIGGGVIIKPVLDMFGVASVATISFLSSCTVLTMSFYSVGRNVVSKSGSIEMGTGTPLALGAAVGGICGNLLFSWVKDALGGSTAGAAQSICLMILTFGTLIYTVKKSGINTRSVTGKAACLVIGFALGGFSSFLGIGGGPFNLVVLHYFFGMETKKAASNSLYIILLSQITNLLVSLIGRTVPEFEPMALVLMICGGVGGGIIGRSINKKIDDRAVDKLFICLLFVIVLICIYNTVKYLR